MEVAPFAGAWIEILSKEYIKEKVEVAPFAGAWIEMRANETNWKLYKGRSLRGSVD